MPVLSMRKPESSQFMAQTVQMLQIGAEQAGQRIDNFLLKTCKGVPKSHIYKAIRSGQVRVNKGRCQAEYRLLEGDIVRVPPFRMSAADSRPPAPAATFPIVYEDDALLVIDKPAGVAVHGGSGISFGVIEQLRAARPEAKFLELAHRLDRETSGLLIIAKKRSALVALHEMMREGRGRKRYLALVPGDWVNERQHLRQPLLKWLTASGERRVKVDALGKPAHTIINLRQ
ncbi:MAG: RNA pseudouridine synthase, partial [Pusillimonas sp.]|nr:RNA pseudouridine synthase [Pusillimonas sp.]